MVSSKSKVFLRWTDVISKPFAKHNDDHGSNAHGRVCQHGVAICAAVSESVLSRLKAKACMCIRVLQRR